jgi:hypothetical protein
VKQYMGTRNPEGVRVTVDGMPLQNHPDPETGASYEFHWGGDCPGAAALAWSILVDALESDYLAAEFADQFRLGVVVNWIAGAWTLTQGEVWRWVIKQCERCYDNVRRRGPGYIVV